MARILAVGLLAGCVSVQPVIDRNPLAEPGAPGAIAVVVHGASPVADISASPAAVITPGDGGNVAKGAFGGALLGAWVGMSLAPLALLGPLGAVAATANAILAGGVALGVAAGAAAGASTIVPGDDVAAVRPLIAQAIARMRLADGTAKAVAEDVGRWTPYRSEIFSGEELLAQAGASPYRSLRDRGFGAALDFRLASIGFTGRGGSDPGVRLYLDAEAQLVDTATGSPTALRGLVYLSPPHEAAEWTRDDGALAAAEFSRASRTLAERMVESLVLRTEVFLGAGPAQRYSCGVEPTQPRLAWDDPWTSARHPAAALVSSLNPVLAWESEPPPMSPEERKRAVKKEGIRYDLRIWKTVDGAPAEVAYERDGLDRPEHRVETALEPGTLYFWSIRLRYQAEGQPRATRWSAATSPRFVPPQPLGEALYYSRMDGAKAVRVTCNVQDQTPCGCLYFIPRLNFYRFRTP